MLLTREKRRLSTLWGGIMIGNGGSSADLRESRGILGRGWNSILSGREIYL